MRRRYTVAVTCAHGGCRRRSCFEATTRREERDVQARQDGIWKCSDHRYLDKNLTSERPEIVTRYRLTRDAETDYSYWVETGGRIGLSSGFQHGPGFVARQEDWPEGAVLEVRAVAKTAVDAEIAASEGGDAQAHSVRRPLRHVRQSTFRIEETPPPDDVDEVLAWNEWTNGWTTARRGGKNRDGVDEIDRDPDWWVWSFGITAAFTWWRYSPPAPLDTRQPKSADGTGVDLDTDTQED